VDFDLTDEQVMIRSLAREFAEGEVAPRAEHYDKNREFPYDIVAKLAELGFLGLPVPEEYGGAGADTVSYAVTVEELSRGDASVGITVAAHTSLGTMPFLLFGSEEQKREYVPALASGEMLWSFGLTEPQAGSDAGATRTAAVLDNGEWVINGVKSFITNSGTRISGGVTITAVTGTRDDGRPEISNLIVPTGTPGYAVSREYDKMGWRASDTHELSFTDARVPEGNLLGERGEGFHQFLTVLDGGRISVAALSVGLAQAALDASIKYAKERVQFGKPIAGHQLVQDLLVKSVGNITASIAVCLRASQLQDQGEQRDEHSALAKAFATARMRETVAYAREICGGNGIVLDTGVARFFADAEAIYSYEGTREMNTLIVGRAITGSAAFV
jgi:butyryl-CoA dehydrogenase